MKGCGLCHVTYPRSITSIDSSPFGLESTFISSESFVSIVLNKHFNTTFPQWNFVFQEMMRYTKCLSDICKTYSGGLFSSDFALVLSSDLKILLKKH